MKTFEVIVERIASFKAKTYKVTAEYDEDATAEARHLAANDSDWCNTHNEYEPTSYKEVETTNEVYGIERAQLIKNKISFPVYLTGDKEETHITYTDTLEMESQYLADNELTADGYTLIAIIKDPAQPAIENWEEVFMVNSDYEDFQPEDGTE